ncbi:hypothetical protein [Rheinheimera pacifica]|uniref:hypothetical protein n=1 Tax=Rheinheimera pacifica TaxID=173990 RepID=UPI00115FDB18|nr:hypothetical protein [Rheinheimera pacifica]
MNTIGTVDLVLWLIFLIAWMYFGLNSLMLVLELRLDPKFKNATKIGSAILDLTKPDKNPEGYKSARFHLYGAAITLPLLMIVMVAKYA